MSTYIGFGRLLPFLANDFTLLFGMGWEVYSSSSRGVSAEACSGAPGVASSNESEVLLSESTSMVGSLGREGAFSPTLRFSSFFLARISSSD